MLKQVINVLVMLILILSLYYYPSKTISFICILAVILIIIAILAAKKMLPLFIEKMLKKGKDNLKAFKIIYLILYSLPCLLSDLFKGAKDEYDKQPQGMSLILLLLLILMIIYILLPCIIKWFFTTNPMGAYGKIKSSIVQRIDNAKRAIDSLEEKIWIRRSSTPRVQWTENWITADKKKMTQELIKLGYKSTARESKGLGHSFLRGLNHVCKAYIEPTFLRGTWKLKQNLDKDLTPPRPPIPETIKLIKANYSDMVRDLATLPKLKFEYKQLVDKMDIYLKTYTTKQLLNKPIYTDVETTNNDWYFENLKDGKVYNYSYALSCWVFIHEQALGHGPGYKNYTSLINYGDKPNISYNMENQRLRITMRNNQNQDRTIYETDELPMQTWNNIIINYDGGTLDVFINNKMVASEPNIIPYLSQDKITLGQKNGLSGGICNVIYYPGALSRLKIGMYYETLKNQNPPVLPDCPI